MVVLGGMATVFGPLVGAITLLVSEEILKALTDHNHLSTRTPTPPGISSAVHQFDDLADRS